MFNSKMWKIQVTFGNRIWAATHGWELRWFDFIWSSLKVWMDHKKPSSSQEFLLKFKPMVGFGKYKNWAQVDPNLGSLSGAFSITSTHDLCLAAYSRWILIFMPKLYLCTKYVANLRQAAVSIKIITHRHSLDFGLHVVESYLDRLSSWNQGLVAHFLEKVQT